jgi:hypothetical protein
MCDEIPEDENRTKARIDTRVWLQWLRSRRRVQENREQVEMGACIGGRASCPVRIARKKNVPGSPRCRSLPVRLRLVDSSLEVKKDEMVHQQIRGARFCRLFFGQLCLYIGEYRMSVGSCLFSADGNRIPGQQSIGDLRVRECLLIAALPHQCPCPQ